MDYCSNVADDGGIVVDLNLLPKVVVCTLHVHSSESTWNNKNKKNYCIFVQIVNVA